MALTARAETARRALGTALAALLLTTLAAAQEAPSLRLRMLAAEDARDASAAGIAPLLEGLQSRDVELQRVAVRALGRFEDPSLVPHISGMLGAPEASVRAEAANALAQAYHRQASGAAGAVIARAALEKETHALVRGALLLALGRFKYTTPDAWRAAEVLIADTLFPEQAAGPRGVASPAVLLNGLRGLQALARQAPDKRPLSNGTQERLARLSAPPPVETSATGVVKSYQVPTTAAGTRIRVLAMQALRVGRADFALLKAALTDPAAAVRRAGVSPVLAQWSTLRDVIARQGKVPSDDVATEMYMRRSLEYDPSATVRLEALIGYLEDRLPSCTVVSSRLSDTSPHVVVMAIDGMGRLCAQNTPATASLTAIASGQKVLAGWHGRAHALVSLAQIDRQAAAPLVRAAGRDGNPWVRTYAARALRHLLEKGAARDEPDVALLRTLTADADVNVATAAIQALHATAGRVADDEYVAALARNDRASGDGVNGVPTGYELVLAAVQALEGSPRPGVAIAMLDALDRLTADRRETSRDPRLAIVKWLSVGGGAGDVGRLTPYLNDFDPAVAAAAAALVSARGGTPVTAAPRPLPRAPLPTDAELEALATTKVVLQMKDGGRVEISLLPNEAPLNAFRFVRLAERGFFDGRTIHRVAPNFVVQGGSPGANEYAGDGPFSRDEVGMVSNADGTVGLSTRGRDTGDAQFYVNTNDNTRLDHNYTVFGVIASGRELVDGWMEGDVIAKVTVTR